MGNKVFVFGIDGAVPQKIFEEWVEELPNIKKLINKGCYAKLKSCIPPLSITAWTSMTTGKNPADHGIFEYLYKEKTSNKIRMVSANHVKSKRIWEIVAENNKKAIACFIPLTYPVKSYKGVLVSGPPTPSEETVEITHPKDLKNELNSLLQKPLLLDIKTFRDLSKRDIIDEMYKITKMHLDSMKYLIKNKEWDFFFGTIKSSDRMNHSFWKYCDKLHREYEPLSEFKDTLKEYYKFLDKELGEIIEILDENTIIIVVSDHGITRMHTRINLSDWLIREGYLVLKEEVNNPTRLEMDKIDWEKTKVFAFGAYDGEIYINLKGREANGIVDEKEYEILMKELESKLKDIKGDHGEILKTKVFKKKDYFQGEYKNLAPDMIVYFDDLKYGSNTTKIGNSNLFSNQTALGSDSAAHSQQGIFIMNKSKQKGNIGEVNIIDIFPTILRLLDIKIPENINGKSIR